MNNYSLQEGIERYCPICDALEVFVLLTRKETKDNGTEVECPKCGYKRVYGKEEITA